MRGSNEVGSPDRTPRASTETAAKTAAPVARVVPVVRELRLRRRRTNVPWIYLLYHVDPAPRRARAATGPHPSWRRKKAGTSSGEGGSSAPPPPAAAAAPEPCGVEGSSSTGLRVMGMRPPEEAALSIPVS
jgi:hypothetical protein